ncbi:MAG: hypothetical protein KAS75_08610 [Planctomycetes bacterium]|nr:hypothetical protein [Planctomycetota bacterium]
MKTIQISDQLYDKLKKCIVDPFDDTPESVIGHLIDIVDKSKSRCSSWDTAENTSQQDKPATPSVSPNVQAEREEIVL